MTAFCIRVHALKALQLLVQCTELKKRAQLNCRAECFHVAMELIFFQTRTYLSSLASRRSPLTIRDMLLARVRSTEAALEDLRGLVEPESWAGLSVGR